MKYYELVQHLETKYGKPTKAYNHSSSRNVHHIKNVGTKNRENIKHDLNQPENLVRYGTEWEHVALHILGFLEHGIAYDARMFMKFERKNDILSIYND